MTNIQEKISILRVLSFILTLFIAISAFFIKRDMDKLDSLLSLPAKVQILEYKVTDLTEEIKYLRGYKKEF